MTFMPTGIIANGVMPIGVEPNILHTKRRSDLDVCSLCPYRSSGIAALDADLIPHVTSRHLYVMLHSQAQAFFQTDGTMGIRHRPKSMNYFFQRSFILGIYVSGTDHSIRPPIHHDSTL